MESGAAETYDRLNTLVVAQATMMERSIEIVRIFEAPRELVYEAWTDPEHMTQWWGTQSITNHSCKLDVRPGGAWANRHAFARRHRLRLQRHLQRGQTTPNAWSSPTTP